MEEDNRVLLRKNLINLAQRITRYFNHWLFLKVFRVINGTPKGLRLKKPAQIGNTSESFWERWSEILHNAEHDLQSWT